MTEELLKECVHYNSETGVFTRKKKTTGSKGTPGTILGAVSHGYLTLYIERKRYSLHRLAFMYMTGIMPDMVDHINGNKSDNRWLNLRSCTRSQNNKNVIASKNSKTGYLHIHPDGVYFAVIVHGKYISNNKTIDEAIMSRDKHYEAIGFEQHSRRDVCNKES